MSNIYLTYVPAKQILLPNEEEGEYKPHPRCCLKPLNYKDRDLQFELTEGSIEHYYMLSPAYRDLLKRRMKKNNYKLYIQLIEYDMYFKFYNI